jgi:molybdate transport system substrate-binding protein
LLIYWTIKDLKLKGDLQEITNSNIRKIALANPNNAPFGIASVEALKSLFLYDTLKNSLVFAENVSQISQYVLNNNVDIGFTGKSIVLSPKLKGRGQYFDVDEKLYSPIEQYVLLLKNGASNNNAQKYIDFLFSDSAQSIFKRYGYKIPD